MTAKPPMTCREFVDFLMDYLNGELDPPVLRNFEWHLSVCPNCVRYLETYQDTVSLARVACRTEEELPAEVPEDLVQAILAARRG